MIEERTSAYQSRSKAIQVDDVVIFQTIRSFIQETSIKRIGRGLLLLLRRAAGSGLDQQRQHLLSLEDEHH
ncbi:MAG TPA: hypothetical protein P5063_07460, partial [Methanomassiliicoccales archaeon]|nr:hypothetical protein [Methanomassiliicoccales archaeon]